MEQKKIIIHFVPGGYGHFLEGLLNKTLKVHEDNLSDFHWIDKTYSDIVFEKTHDMEKESDEFHIKVTFNESNVDLINRNKWIKWPQNFEQSKQEAFPNSNNIDEITKEIVTKSHFRSYLLKDMDNWNKKVNEQTITIPFNFFLLKKEEWIMEASKIYDRCQIDYDIDYVQKAYSIFQNTQSTILTDDHENKLKEWKDKDTIEKSNIISDFYFHRFFKNDKPIPPSPSGLYSNTSEMLANWVSVLNSTNGILKI